jgi:hypothetical protein
LRYREPDPAAAIKLEQDGHGDFAQGGRMGLTSDGFRIYNTSDHYLASIMERDQPMFARLLLGGVLVALVTFSAGANARDSRREGNQDISQGRRLLKEGFKDIADGQTSEGLRDIRQGLRLINEGHQDHHPVSEH